MLALLIMHCLKTFVFLLHSVLLLAVLNNVQSTRVSPSHTQHHPIVYKYRRSYSSFDHLQATSDKVKRRFDDIEKSTGDSRIYRGLVLKNGFTALLISDSDTDQSAASLSVAVGILNEPRELPGLAHFCEHMMFMGTKKYPAENEFSQFLTQNGGSHNAYTANDHTNFYFSVKTKSLKLSLDMFAQFFLEPLFTTSATEREINAVNSEHENGVADDNRRLKQLRKNTADPNHPFNHFGAGTKETLWDIPNSKNISVRKQLLEFHSKWYSSHLMYLTVLGKEDLNTLEEMVVSLFGDIEKKNVNIPYWPDPIYKEEQLATKTVVVPIKDIRVLSISFLVPEQTKFFKSMPNRYLSALFGHEGNSGILTVLKKRGWSSKLSAGNKFEARGIELFDIDVDLTEQGVDCVDDIIKLIFQYVNMLKREGPQKWFHDENKNISAMQFQFKDKESPLEYVVRLSSRLIKYGLKDVLTAEYIIKEWRPDLIENLLSYFRPENMRVTVVSKVFQNKTDTVDKYYGTSYSISKIPMEVLNHWQEGDLCNDLKMPFINEFIATDFGLVPINTNEPDQPYVIHESFILRSWFKTDTEFRVPKAFVSVDFFNHNVITDPFHCNIMSLFVRLINDNISEYTWDATRAGLHLSIEPSSNGFKILLNGFSHKLHILLKKTIEKLLTFKFDSLRFDILKEENIRDLKNIAIEQPHNIALIHETVILSETAWTPEELLSSIYDVTVVNIEEFMKQFFSHMFMESLIYGNIDKIKAIELIQIVEKPFLGRDGSRKLLPRQMIRSRQVQLDDGSWPESNDASGSGSVVNCYRFTILLTQHNPRASCQYIIGKLRMKLADGESTLYETTNNYHSSSCVTFNLQCGVQSTLNNMIVNLFNQIVMESCFHTLRTKEQLGYIVFSLVIERQGVLSFQIIVQSERSPMYVDTRIESYIDGVQDLLKNMSNEEFEKYKDSLAVILFEKPKGSMEQAAVYQLEIDKQNYNFNRAEIESEALKSINKMDIIQFYADQISQFGPKRHKLAVHIKSSLKITNENNQFSQSDNSLGANNSTIIMDITDFKKKHRLYSLPIPFIPVGYKTFF